MANDIFEDLFSRAPSAPMHQPPELASAWRLFEHIAEHDPGAVGSKDDALATFRDCLATVRTPRPESDADRVPF